MPELTGVLRDAQMVFVGDGAVLFGKVFSDSKGRFRDGEDVRTSFLTGYLPGCVFRTRNSTYKVETWL